MYYTRIVERAVSLVCQIRYDTHINYSNERVLTRTHVLHFSSPSSHQHIMQKGPSIEIYCYNEATRIMHEYSRRFSNIFQRAFMIISLSSFLCFNYPLESSKISIRFLSSYLQYAYTSNIVSIYYNEYNQSNIYHLTLYIYRIQNKFVISTLALSLIKRIRLVIICLANKITNFNNQISVSKVKLIDNSLKC